jgi:hypothetical protein
VTFTMMILSRYIFKYFGWGVAALITPTVLLITGIAFFSLVLFSDSVAPTLKALGLTPLMAAVLVGAAQNVFSKSSKYSLFDPCKEMAYIPLDDEVGSPQPALPVVQMQQAMFELCTCFSYRSVPEQMAVSTAVSCFWSQLALL